MTATGGACVAPPADALQNVLRYSLNEAIANAVAPDAATFNCGTAGTLESLLALGTFYVAQVPYRFVRVAVDDVGLAAPTPITNSAVPITADDAPSNNIVVDNADCNAGATINRSNSNGDRLTTPIVVGKSATVNPAAAADKPATAVLNVSRSAKTPAAGRAKDVARVAVKRKSDDSPGKDDDADNAGGKKSPPAKKAKQDQPVQRVATAQSVQHKAPVQRRKMGGVMIGDLLRQERLPPVKIGKKTEPRNVDPVTCASLGPVRCVRFPGLLSLALNRQPAPAPWWLAVKN